MKRNVANRGRVLFFVCFSDSALSIFLTRLSPQSHTTLILPRLRFVAGKCYTFAFVFIKLISNKKNNFESIQFLTKFNEVYSVESLV